LAPPPAQRGAQAAPLAPPPAREQILRGLTGPDPGPVELSEVALFTHEGRDSHSLQEVYRLPDGRTMLTFDSYDTSRDRDREPGSYTVAFDPAGKQLWEFRPEGGHEIQEHLFLADRTYVVTRGNGAWDGSTLTALDAQGREMWRFESEGRTHIDSIQADPAGNVFVKVGDEVTRLDPSGQRVWKKSLRFGSDEYFHVVAPDGSQLFAGDNFSNNFGYDRFRLLSPDGKVEDAELPDIGSFPLVVGDRLCYAGEHGEMRGVNLNTLEAWEVTTESRALETPVSGPDGRVYFTARYGDDRLYCVSPDGRLLWQREVTDAAPAGTADAPFKPGPGGVIYYAGDDHETVRRIGPDGNPLPPLKVPEGFESFLPSEDGFLYTLDREGRIRRYEADGSVFELALKIEESVRYELVAAEPGGVVTFQDGLSGKLFRVKVDPQAEVDRIQRRIEQQPAEPSHGPGIREEEKWVVVGPVRLRKRGY
ncbi:MAG: PQQ-binding-like beta-propeller repeat protein, partial [Candidatus Eremiobacterota bacterium]